MNAKVAQLLVRLIILSLVGTISACGIAPTKNIKERSDWVQAIATGNKSVVFGRMQWLEHGEEKQIGKGLFEFSVSPILLRMEDRSKTIGEVDENGEFVWTLDPGTYVINRINYRDPWSGNYFIVPQVALRVPDKGKIYYIGTLKSDFASKRDLIGGLSGQVKVVIEDQGEGGYAAFAKKSEVIPTNIEKSLMVHEQNLPRTIDTTTEFNMALRILNAIFFGLSQ